VAKWMDWMDIDLDPNGWMKKSISPLKSTKKNLKKKPSNPSI